MSISLFFPALDGSQLIPSNKPSSVILTKLLLHILRLCKVNLWHYSYAVLDNNITFTNSLPSIIHHFHFLLCFSCQSTYLVSLNGPKSTSKPHHVESSCVFISRPDNHIVTANFPNWNCCFLPCEH